MREVSVYIPCFNNEDTIGGCIEAVLAQTYPIQDVIVVDDASTDTSVEIVSGYPVRLIPHPSNKGLAAARNTALAYIRTEYAASCDADCRPHPDWLKHLMHAVDNDSIAGAGGQLIEGGGSAADSWRAVHMKQQWGKERCSPDFLYGSNTLYRRQALFDAGLYNETFRNNYEDVDMCRRLSQEGYRFVYEPAARCSHCRRDSAGSVLDTFWLWHVSVNKTKGCYEDSERFLKHIADAMGTANRFFEEDYAAGRHYLCYLDFLMALHHPFRDYAYFRADEAVLRKPVALCAALALFDLTFSFHYTRNAQKFPGMLPASSAYASTVLASCLALGSLLYERFPSGVLPRLIFKELLCCLGIPNEYVLEKLLALSSRDNGWSAFYKQREHPLLDVSFIDTVQARFKEWTGQLMARYPELGELLEKAAQETYHTQQGEALPA